MTDPQTTLQTAADALRRGDFAAAFAASSQGLDNAPDHPALLGITALALLQLHRKEEALPYLRRHVAVAPQDRAARFNLATVLTATGNEAEARPLAMDHGGHPGLARLAGYFHQQDGATLLAAQAYRAALDAAPQDWESWNNLGNCLAVLGDSAGAIAAFENAINRQPPPGLPEVFLNLSQALSAVENREKRLDAAQEAARRFPEHQAVRIELGLAQAAAGRRDLAEITLRRAAAAEHQFGEARLELGLLLENDNRLDELDAHIAECEALDPGAELAFLKAWALRRRERFAEARIEADRIPDTINPIRTAQVRAEIAERLGEADEAFRQFEAMNRASQAAHPPGPGPSYRQTIEAQTAAMAAPLPPVPADPDAPPDAAVHRVVERDELQDRLAVRLDVVGVGEHLHAGADRHVAGDVEPAALDLHEAHAAVAGRRQVRVPAEVRHEHAVLERHLQDRLVLARLDRLPVQEDFRHSRFPS